MLESRLQTLIAELRGRLQNRSVPQVARAINHASKAIRDFANGNRLPETILFRRLCEFFELLGDFESLVAELHRRLTRFTTLEIARECEMAEVTVRDVKREPDRNCRVMTLLRLCEFLDANAAPEYEEPANVRG